MSFKFLLILQQWSAIISSLVGLFYCFDICMESFSLLITHITAIIRKLILIAMYKMNLDTRISAYVLMTL